MGQANLRTGQLVGRTSKLADTQISRNAYVLTYYTLCSLIIIFIIFKYFVYITFYSQNNIELDFFTLWLFCNA